MGELLILAHFGVLLCNYSLTVLEDEDDIPGGYFLTFGSEIIGSYDGTLHPRPCFEQHWYIFGDGCEAGFAPTEGMVAESNCLVTLSDSIQRDEQNERCVNFEFMVDAISGEFPVNARFKLEDVDGIIVWDEAIGYIIIDQDVHFAKSTCLDPMMCYRFTYYDSAVFPNSLTETTQKSENDHVSFSLTVGDHLIGSYNGTSDGCNAAKWYQFGLCPGGETSGMIGPNTCIIEADHVKDLVEQPTPCEPLVFSIFTDEYPMDISYKLTNADGLDLWDVGPNTLTDQNSLYRRESCLDRDDCYVFALYDSDRYQDG